MADTPQKLTNDTPQPKRASLVAVVPLSFLAVFGSTLIFAEQWLFNTWDELTTDEIIWHLAAPLEGTDTYTITEFLTGYLPYLLLLIAALVGIVILGYRRGKLAHAGTLVAAISLTLIGCALYDFYQQAGIAEYLAAADGSQPDFIEQYYVDPRETSIAFPEQKRNLVYVFLESMEITCADEANGGAFDFNCIPELAELASEGENFSGESGVLNGAITLPGSNWTMGAMFAQTSGAPLKLAVGGNEAASLKSFFPEMVTLGDILEEQGYRQELLIGSEAQFGGRDLYFAEHGNYDILDYDYAIDQGWVNADDRVGWGYQDMDLFRFAREQLGELAAGELPFNLTMLTVDTHFEDGMPCPLCTYDFEGNQYANVHACSSRQVAEFVRWIQEQDFYENTTVVLCGDHITMDRDFYQGVPSDYQRKCYTLVLNGAAEVADPARERTYSTFDLFPTTLAAMGAKVQGGRLGLGVDLYGSKDTILERRGISVCAPALARMSFFLEQFGTNVGLDEKTLEAFAEEARLHFEDDGKGGLKLMLYPCNHLSLSLLDAAWVEIADDRTPNTYRVALEPVAAGADTNGYRCEARTSYSQRDVPHLTVEAYVDAGEFESYPVATLEDA